MLNIVFDWLFFFLNTFLSYLSYLRVSFFDSFSLITMVTICFCCDDRFLLYAVSRLFSRPLSKKKEKIPLLLYRFHLFTPINIDLVLLDPGSSLPLPNVVTDTLTSPVALASNPQIISPSSSSSFFSFLSAILYLVSFFFSLLLSDKFRAIFSFRFSHHFFSFHFSQHTIFLTSRQRFFLYLSFSFFYLKSIKSNTHIIADTAWESTIFINFSLFFRK